MKTLDCSGLSCPEPVLRTKAHLEAQPGEPFTVVVDNEASRENVLRFGRSQGCEVAVEESGKSNFSITIRPVAGQNATEEFRAEEYGCEIPAGGDLVYVISSDSMGRGSDELGWALLQTYVATIAQVSPLPSHILLYNGGVRLSTSEGKALEALQSLEEKGVTIWICGTCLEFFKLEHKRQVGSITNMYDIMNTMAGAARLVSPF
jgi:selenium metabolism protein YedF